MYLYLMQGLPGSGKSYHAQKIAEEFKGVIASADDYPGLYTYLQSGTVVYNTRLQAKAHAACLRKAIEALHAGKNVVVDNTNTTRNEVEPYVRVAHAFGALPVLVRINCDPEKAFARNTHGVPLAVHKGMAERLANFTPADRWRDLGFATLTHEG